MRAISLETLQSQLREYILLAQAGEIVLVTEKDLVIAELGPSAHKSPYPWPLTGLEGAVARGWITLPADASASLPPRQPVTRFTDLLRDLTADRDDR
jgi:hypothetical protein